MKHFNSFLAILILMLASNIIYAQGGRQLGARRLILDNNDGIVANNIFLVNNGGTLGADNAGIITPGTYPSTCALLDLSSTKKGFLAPRMTALQELAICGGLPPEGLIVYNLTTHTLDVYNGSAWGASGWALTGNTGTNSAVNFLGTTDAQDLVIKTNGVERARVLSSGGLISRVNGIGAYGGPTSGVVGLTNATSGAGIVGLNGLTNASGSVDGGLGVGQGIYGETIKDAAAGVEGINSGAATWGFGVIGGVTSGTTVQAGVLGISATNTGAQNYGVAGEYTTGGIGVPAPPTSIANAAVMGVSTVAAGFGVGADNTAAGGTGLRAQANGGGGIGVDVQSAGAGSTGVRIGIGSTPVLGTDITAIGAGSVGARIEQGAETGIHIFHTATTGNAEGMRIQRLAAGTQNAGIHILAGTTGTITNGINIESQAGGTITTGMTIQTTGGGAMGTGLNVTGPGTSISANGTIQTTGDVTLTPAALHAVGGVESLRIIRGTVNANGTINLGSGFTVNHVAGSGIYTINFNVVFTGTPSLSFGSFAGAPAFVDANGLGFNSCFVDTYNQAGALTDEGFSFIAIGPR
jgi:hypothetical protein